MVVISVQDNHTIWTFEVLYKDCWINLIFSQIAINLSRPLNKKNNGKILVGSCYDKIGHQTGHTLGVKCSCFDVKCLQTYTLLACLL